MQLELFLLLLLLVAVGAGFLGSLVGLGGGVVLVPTLAVVFGLPFPFAVGASAVSVLATSTASGAAYVSDRLTNLRVSTFLQAATVPGALIGATVTIFVARWGLTSALLLALGVLLLGTLPATLARRNQELPQAVEPDRWSRRLGLGDQYHDEVLHRDVPYEATGSGRAFGVMFGAGLVSGMFGIGSGILKVLALEREMRLPMKVATATSNFMIGVTVAAGVGILLTAGYIDPVLTAPVALGTAVGSFGGSRLLPRLTNRTVRWIFVPVLVALSLELILRGLGVV